MRKACIISPSYKNDYAGLTHSVILSSVFAFEKTWIGFLFAEEEGFDISASLYELFEWDLRW